MIGAGLAMQWCLRGRSYAVIMWPVTRWCCGASHETGGGLAVQSCNKRRSPGACM